MNINEETNSNNKKDSAKDFDATLRKEVEKNDLKEKSQTDEEYKLGWNSYSEITNGRFAMLGFFAILLIEFLSNQSFFEWAGIIN
tara:strand:- start:886 stop:1140 length:255 start_codon:yes stop_codon:yes gene_type:complete